MITKSVLLLAAAVLSTCITVFAKDPNFHIYLCFGQSNMDGFPGIEDRDKGEVDKRFQVLTAIDSPQQGRTAGAWYTATPPLARPNAGIGPADYFGRTMVTHLPKNVRIGIVLVTIPGGRIEVFQPDKVEALANDGPDWLKNFIGQYDGDPYARLIELGKQAQKDGVIKGILFHQGESNGGDAEWREKVKSVHDKLLEDLHLDAKDVPFLVGELVGKDEGGKCAGMNDLIARFPEQITNAHVISSAGCAALPDGLHFTPAGYRLLGTRYAEQMLKLMGKPVANPVSRAGR
ncbi:MAG: sialate O-acetylesterase [Akkermansiaceae bacterium]|nr:sialate O-acetylesterase [Akkermansiaceae bacterium]